MNSLVSFPSVLVTCVYHHHILRFVLELIHIYQANTWRSIDKYPFLALDPPLLPVLAVQTGKPTSASCHFKLPPYVVVHITLQ